MASFIVLAIFFVLTGFVVRSYHAQERALARRWRERGEAALQAGHASQAVEDFHNALNYSRGNDLDLLNLAQALMQERHLDEAEAYLRTLWAREPGDGEVNLELARLAEMRGNTGRAIRYYHDAIYGVWVRDAILRRREVRLALIRLLLRQGMTAHADSELITLAGGLPQASSAHLQAGRMFLQVQDYRHALKEFQHVIQNDPRQAAAWAGAGEAAFHLGRYGAAERYLSRAAEERATDPMQAQELAVSRAILSSDPYEPRLPERARVRRALLDFNRALARVKECAKSTGKNLSADGSSGPLEAAYAQLLKIKPNAVEWRLLRQPDLLLPLMDAVSSAEAAAGAECGPGTPLDQALILMTGERGAVRD